MITEKSTKAQILKAYEDAMAQLKSVARTTVADEQETKRIAGVVDNAQEIVSLGILNPEIEAQYKDLQEAIKLAKKELEELFGIKAEALSFEAVVNAKNDKVKEIDALIAEKVKNDLEREKTTRADYDRIFSELNKEVAEKRKALEIERKREAEEFAYNLNRERKKEDDAWFDKKLQREKELAVRESEVEAREEAMEIREDEIAELKAEVASIPVVIEEAVKEATERAKAKAFQSSAIEKSHLKKEHEWETNTLRSEVDSLKSQLRNLFEEKNTLAEKLENAYAQMRELATTTVQSSQIKVIETHKTN